MLTKYVVRAMMADGGGRVVNVASIVGFTGYSGLSVYGATKASLLGFTRSLAREVGRMGVNVNAVAPGFMDTEMTQEMDDAQRGRWRGAARCAGYPKSTTSPMLWRFCWAKAAAISPAPCSRSMPAARPERSHRVRRPRLDQIGKALPSSGTNAPPRRIIEIDRIVDHASDRSRR